MKHLLTSLITMAVLALITPACNKHNNNPTDPNKGDSAHTYTINLSYPDSSTTPATDWELIINEPGGKLLLDTIVPINTNIKASIKTNATLVNLTSVEKGPRDTAFRVITLMSIDPTTIPTPVPVAAISPQLVEPTITRRINFTNIPLQAQDPQHPAFFSQDISAGVYPVYNGSTTTGRRINNPILITWPTKGLYHFYPWRDVAADTCDLSLLTDTAAYLDLTTHTGYGRATVWLEGIMDTTDFRKSIFLYNYVQNTYSNGSVPHDVVYPTKGVQKYDMRAGYVNTTDSTNVTCYSYGNTITADHPWMDATNFTLQSRTQDNVSLTFNNISLSYYQTQWSAPGMNFFVYVNPDSTTTQPLKLFNTLHSQRLQSLNITSLTPNSLYLFTAPGYGKYADFLAYDCSPVQYRTRRVTGYTYLQKRLR